MLSIKRKLDRLAIGMPLVVTGVLLGIGLALTLPSLAHGQNGPYRLVIEGEVYRAGLGPGMNKPVSLTTSQGEVLKTKTDGDGHFTLTGEVTADGGELAVHSGAVSSISFGSMNVTWSAGGPGDKYLTVNLITDGKALWSDATEPPYPAPLPGEEPPPEPTAKALSTTVPTPLPTPVMSPGETAQPTPSPAESDSTPGWLGCLLGVVMLGGLVLLAAGARLLIADRRRQS